MRTLFGKQQIEIGISGLAECVLGRFPVHIDVGAGSGRMMLGCARQNPEGFFIGMDPSAQSMRENSAKAAKLERKKQLDNLIFVIAPIEAPPNELAGVADLLTVILPWGSLRDGIVRAEPAVLGNLRKLGKPGSALEILVGYEGDIEPGEIKSRSLPALSHEYFHALAQAYRNAGIAIRGVKAIGNDELKHVESDWAKKLAYGKARTTFRLDCVLI